MIPSVRADFLAAANAIESGYYDHESLSYTHILIEIGRLFVENGQSGMNDGAVVAALRAIAGPEVAR